MRETCCVTLKVKYLKKNGSIKEFKKYRVDITSVKSELDSIANLNKFKKFIEVKYSHICFKRFPGIRSETESNSDYEGDVSDNTDS